MMSRYHSKEFDNKESKVAELEKFLGMKSKKCTSRSPNFSSFLEVNRMPINVRKIK